MGNAGGTTNAQEKISMLAEKFENYVYGESNSKVCYFYFSSRTGVFLNIFN